MPSIQQLDLDCTIFHQCKIKKCIPAPGSACKTKKNSITNGRNNVHTSHDIEQVAPINRLVNRSSQDKKDLVYKIDLIDSRSKSVLKQ